MPKKQYSETQSNSYRPYCPIRSEETDPLHLNSDFMKEDLSWNDFFLVNFLKINRMGKFLLFLLSGFIIFSTYGCSATDYRNNYYGGMGEFSNNSEYDDTWEQAVTKGSTGQKSAKKHFETERNSFFDFSFLPGFKKNSHSKRKKFDDNPQPLELSFEDRLCPIDQVDLQRNYDDFQTVSRPNPLTVTKNEEISQTAPSLNLQNIRNSITIENNTAHPLNQSEILNNSIAMENSKVSRQSDPLVSSSIFTPSNVKNQNMKSRSSKEFPSLNNEIVVGTRNNELVADDLVKVIPSTLPPEMIPIHQAAAIDPVFSNSIRPVSAEKSVPSIKENNISWKEEAEKAISHLQKEIEKRKAEGVVVSEQELRLRLLYLAVDEHEKAMRQWKDVPASMNDFWACECRGLTAFLNGSENKDPAGQITQAVAHFEKGVEELKESEPIKIVKCLSVESPAPFGLYKPARSTVKSGDLIHIYAELENVVNRSEKDGEHLALQCSWILIDEKGKMISTTRTQRCATRSASRLRDIVLNVSEEIPAMIKPGIYYLRLEAVDLQTDKPEPNNRCSVDVPITVAPKNH